MRRLLPLLMIVAVLWCSLHGLSADHAVADLGNAACAETAERADASPDAPLGKAAPDHVGHHHCPIAPDRQDSLAGDAPLAASDRIFSPPAAALPSLAAAPPLQPPAA